MDSPVIWVMCGDPEMRCLIELNLCKRALRCREAPSLNGSQPLPERPDVIILDVGSSTGPGWQAARTLRGIGRLDGVPIILMVETAPPASRLAELGPVSIARKPIAMDELLVMVRQCLA